MVEEGREKVDVTIRIRKDSANRLDEIVGHLRQAGLAQVERHDRFSIVSGTVEEGKVDALREVKGVASVRPDTTYRAQT
jgi:hypothetical protein